MPAPWTKTEERLRRRELIELYTKANKTIGEIAQVLDLAESAVYDRLIRLDIPVRPWTKLKYNNRNFNITVPTYSPDLAEFVGILLGDGHLTPTQVTVTLGTKESKYVQYVTELMRKLFKVKPKIITSKRGDKVVYLGSTVLVRWFLGMGLAYNKAASQVDIPNWCFRKKEFLSRVIKGLIDTDGSIYKLKFGIQISFCNKSQVLLHSVRRALLSFGFSPSQASANKVYLTKREDIDLYFKIIGFSNVKHHLRFLAYRNRGQVVELDNYTRL